MKNIIEIDGTHYEKAKAWVLSKAGDSIIFPSGDSGTLLKKNPKSGVFEINGKVCNIPIKKILDNGSDAYIKNVMRDIPIESSPSSAGGLETEFDLTLSPNRHCIESLPLARKIIRYLSCSTNLQADTSAYLQTRLSKAESLLSIDKLHNAAIIAIKHLSSDYPCPLRFNERYSLNEWQSFDSWFFSHKDVLQLIANAERFDKELLEAIGVNVYRSVFGEYKSKSAKTLACSLRSCLHSWFRISTNDREAQHMAEAYAHLMSRIDFQYKRMSFIKDNIIIFDKGANPQEVTDKVLNSPAQDVLDKILTNIHGIKFGYSSRSPIPQFSDLMIKRVNIKEIEDAQIKERMKQEEISNNFARATAKEIIRTTISIESLTSNHMPYINRKLTENGCKKFTKSRNKKTGDVFLGINCGYRHLTLPLCDDEVMILMAKQYMASLSDLVDSPTLTHDELDSAILIATSKTNHFIQSLSL